MNKNTNFEAHNLRAAEFFNSLPLKEMDAAMLLAELMILIETKLVDKVNYDKITSAISFASFLHRNDMRANRAHLPKTPYIEHPLRNTIRAVRFGAEDENILIACLLHDVIEDHSEDIVRLFANKDTADMNEYSLRKEALEYMSSVYGLEVSSLVHHVSNQLKDPSLTTEEKNVIYFNHFQDITKNPAALLVKVVDLIDNAGSLYATEGTLGVVSTEKKARKYIPVISEIEDNLYKYNLESVIPKESMARLDARFKSILTQLHNFVR